MDGTERKLIIDIMPVNGRSPSIKLEENVSHVLFSDPRRTNRTIFCSCLLFSYGVFIHSKVSLQKSVWHSL